jgi:hypothetical protein
MFEILLILLSTDAQIEKYVEDLGNKRWYYRDQASRKLMLLGERSQPFLEKIKIGKDLEVDSRVEKLFDIYCHSILPTSYGKLPWIDGLPDDYPNRDSIVRYYMADKSRDWDKDLEYYGFRAATLDFVIDLCKEGKSRKEIVSLLDKMVEGEKKQLEQMRKNSEYYNNNVPKQIN